MSVYRIAEDGFEPLRETSFEAEKLYERTDMQRMLRNKPEVLEEGLFIVAEEYSDWVESNRRIDLLAVDGKGRLVVIELKRSDEDSLMDLQAIRYAAMVANMPLEKVIDAHKEHLRRLGKDDDAESRISQQLSGDDGEIHIDSSKPRIILGSANFSKELTTSVLWLNDIGMEITCVKLQPYTSEEGIYLERSQVIPIPNTEDYKVRWGPRRIEQKEPSQVETSLGADLFKSAIKTAHESSRESLDTWCGLAMSLEQQGLAKLVTNSGSYNTVLRVQLPGSASGLFNIFRNKLGYGYVQFNGPNFDKLAPRSKERLEEIISPETIGLNSTRWELPDGFLKALTDAYREANGLLSESVGEKSAPPEEQTESSEEMTFSQ